MHVHTHTRHHATQPLSLSFRRSTVNCQPFVRLPSYHHRVLDSTLRGAWASSAPSSTLPSSTSRTARRRVATTRRAYAISVADETPPAERRRVAFSVIAAAAVRRRAGTERRAQRGIYNLTLWAREKDGKICGTRANASETISYAHKPPGRPVETDCATRRDARHLYAPMRAVRSCAGRESATAS